CALLVLSGSADGIARSQLPFLAAVAIQLRLLANLLDGMVAVEHGRGRALGPVWNELPDRSADAMFLVGAGYGAALAGISWAAPVGWLCAVLAVLTAYVRELGRSLGFAADFSGPMAKPHRMALLTAACAVSAAENLWGWHGMTLAYALVLMAAGTALTAARRTAHLAAALKRR
ncbi:MAG: CDP-alcohol phosphatidyltransferase family protein, partial [Caulobacteraceae bacterium]